VKSVDPSFLRLAALAACAGLISLVVACGAAPATTPVGTAAVTVELGAEGVAFDQELLTVPAGSSFAIRFENRDTAPHNVTIRGSAPQFVGETFSGPAERTYQVPALAAGEYEFICDLHPEMKGTLVSR
jgi:plastocyanin